MIVKPKDLIIQVSALYNSKLEKGVSTGWADLDQYFTVKQSEFTVITGMPSHGKSEWLDALAVNLVMQHNYRIAIFSPENYPLELHVAKIIEKLSEEKFFGSNRIAHDDMQLCLDLMQKHFAFIVPNENQFTPKDILNEAYPWLNQSITQPKAMIIDPGMRMDHYRPSRLSETEYISRTLNRATQNERDFKVHLFLVAHPKK